MFGAVVEVEVFGDYGADTGAITLPNLSLTTWIMCGVGNGVRRSVGSGVRRCVGIGMRRWVGRGVGTFVVTTLARVMDIDIVVGGMGRVGMGRGRIVGISGWVEASFREGHCR